MSENNLESSANIAVTPSLVYADRIIGFAIGPAVSKLNLGMEVNPTTYTPTTTLVIPTTALIDSMSFILKTMHESGVIKSELLKGLEAIKEQYSNL